MKKILSLCLMMCVSASMVFAQAAYDIKELTPEIKTAMEARKARFAELKVFKGLGVIGETNRGYLHIFDGEAGANALVGAENRDRKFIYRAIVEQNGLKSSDLETVEKVFAGIQREKAALGEKLQDDAGNWK